ncbi:MAG: PfkB family carbohydrate kinase [Pseudomonadota bacterium]
MSTPILCIGSVLWDIIGTHEESQKIGFDKGGHISILPGGVAMNIAMALRRFDQPVALLTYLGQDAQGDSLIADATARGMDCAHILRGAHPTDRYMAIEAGGNLFAAIADAHSLEKNEADVIAPLLDGRLGSADQPWVGMIVLDGNLTEHTLEFIAENPAFRAADIRLAPASPGKALRLRPFLGAANGTAYVNLEEAGTLLGAPAPDAQRAAKALVQKGMKCAVVTDGGNPCAFATVDAMINATPPSVMVKRVTGAGDSFMAAHISAEMTGADAAQALQHACAYAAEYISSEGQPNV